MLGSSVGSTSPTGPNFGTLPVTSKKFDAVVGASSAGLVIRNPLGAEGVKASKLSSSSSEH